MKAVIVIVAKVAEVAQGRRALPEGKERLIKLGSAAKYIFSGFAAAY